MGKEKSAIKGIPTRETKEGNTSNFIGITHGGYIPTFPLHSKFNNHEYQHYQ